MYIERNANLRSLGYASYNDYLSSSQWRQIRESVLMRDKRRCVCCCGSANQVHHRSYSIDALAGRDLSKKALVSMCGACHRHIEFMYGQKSTPEVVEAALVLMMGVDGIPEVESKSTYCGRSGKGFRPSVKRKNKLANPVHEFCVECRTNRVSKHYHGMSDRKCGPCQNKCKLVSAGCP